MISGDSMYTFLYTGHFEGGTETSGNSKMGDFQGIGPGIYGLRDDTPMQNISSKIGPKFAFFRQYSF